jgi:ADP-ribose pyrophosphatase
VVLKPAEQTPLSCLRLGELIEEAGVEVGTIDHLGSILTTPGFTDEVIHLFLARVLAPAPQRLDADEVLVVERARERR